MSEADFTREAMPDTYGAFLEDLKQSSAEVRSDEEIRELIRKTRDQNLSEEQRQKARNEIIDANLRTIPFVIKNLRRTGTPSEELVGEGFEVLNSCIDNFDTDYISLKTEDTVKFSSYLITSLRLSLQNPRFIESVGQKVPLPVYIKNYATVMKKVWENFLQEFHREPNADEWYKATADFLGQHRSIDYLEGLSPETFDAAKTHKIEKKYVSLGKKVGSGRINSDTLDTSLGNIENTIADPDGDVESTAMKTFLEEGVEKVLDMLSHRERMVVRFRYGIGLNDEGKQLHPMTLAQVASLLGVTRERIRQIELRALKKMRHPSRAKKIRDYADINNSYERVEAEGMHYKGIVRDTATRLLPFNRRENVVAILQQLRQGSAQTGRFDKVFLEKVVGKNSMYFLVERERQLKSSPRMLASDLLEAINQTLSNVKSGAIWIRDDKGYSERGMTNYWTRADYIQPDEVNVRLDQLIASVAESEVDDDYLSEEYREAVDKMAGKVIAHITPEEFKDMFSRGMYVEGQNGKRLNPNVFGVLMYDMEKIADLIEKSNKNVLDIGQDVARAITKRLGEIPKEKRNLTWRKVDEINFSQEDFENWVQAANNRLERWR